MNVLLGIVTEAGYAEALERTVERAREAGDDLTIAIIEKDSTDVETSTVTETVQRVLADAGVDAEVRHIEGDPGSQLVEIAETEGFDRIALGGGQTSPMGKIKIGSTAEFVLLNSHTTVTLVR